MNSPPEREHQQYAEHGRPRSARTSRVRTAWKPAPAASADDFADSTLTWRPLRDARWVASSISRINTRDHAHTTATHTIWITGQLQYITPGFSTGALPHASLTTPMITSPRPAQNSTNVAIVAIVNVTSEFLNPCASPSRYRRPWARAQILRISTASTARLRQAAAPACWHATRPGRWSGRDWL